VIERVKAFGIPVATVNGNDVIEVEAAARRLIAEVRAGGGPRYLHAHTYRWLGHLAHDRGLYRDAAEVEAAKQDDCIVNAERWLTQQGVAAAALAAVRDEARRVIDAAVAAALAAPWPDVAETYTDVQDVGSPAAAAATTATTAPAAQSRAGSCA
jgi:pyruvate dehydrogenase E1 component alpha subunit